MKKHYYKIYIYECPVCGRGDEERERVYGERPKDGSRFEYVQHYDYCMERG